MDSFAILNVVPKLIDRVFDVANFNIIFQSAEAKILTKNFILLKSSQIKQIYFCQTLIRSPIEKFHRCRDINNVLSHNSVQ